MKFRAGHGQEAVTPLSAAHCGRAKARLAAVGSPSAGAAAGATLAPKIRLHGAAFWAAHEARIRAMTARIEQRWRCMASR